LIRTVIFDIGWVFVHLNPRPILDFLAAHEADCEHLEAMVERIKLEDHETGRLSGFDLVERLTALTKRPCVPEQMHAKWVDMFELQPAMVNLAHSLTERYRVYLLSNIGDLHWSHLCREYQLHRVGHGILPSYLAGYMKPHEGIYIEAERRFGLQPGATVFIDDKAENIEAARRRGWHGIVHSSHAQTCVELAALGVQL
jgi:FMN phosphatase YigB (HAD superfamily)